MEDNASVVRANLDWFQSSGIMRPADGFWGVAERLAVLDDNEAADKIRQAFPSHTMLRPGLAVLEHRRADCTLETAFLFDLAADVLADETLRKIADNLIDFLMDRSALRNTEADSPDRDLWGWALLPGRTRSYWADDNAWMATLFLALAQRGRENVREPGLAAARTLCRQATGFMQHIERNGPRVAPPTDTPYQTCKRFAPHWMGLVTMALAHASAIDDALPWLDAVEPYYRCVLDGPPEWDQRYQRPVPGKPAWPITEYAYLALTGSIVVARGVDEAAKAAQYSADLLAAKQADDGHIPSRGAIEAPSGENLADLVYTDNWAALGFYHAWRVFGKKRYRDAFERSLRFLARIQDRSDDVVFRGCWRGMYDTAAGCWGGGDRYEGGGGSIYSGWTNAPIAWAFLFNQSGESLLA